MNGKVKTLKSKIGLTDQFKNTKAELTVTISGDDKVIYTEKLKAGEFPKDLEINLKNVLKLQVKVQSTGTYDSEIGLFNPVFTK